MGFNGWKPSESSGSSKRCGLPTMMRIHLFSVIASFYIFNYYILKLKQNIIHYLT